MKRNRNKTSTANSTALDQTSAAEPTLGTAIPNDLTAAVEQMNRSAAEGLVTASQRRTDAAEIEADAQARIDAITREAEQQARELRADADRREREAHSLTDRATWLANANAERAHAAEADRRVADLEAEHARLAQQAVDQAAKLAALATDHDHTDRQLAAALAGSDVEAVTALRNRIASLTDLTAAAEAARTAAQERLQAIGDGTGPGELTAARQLAEQRHATIARILRNVYPDSPEAVRYRQAADLAAILEANIARIKADAVRKPPAAQHVVRL
jgi:chromosome segregation ATPase